MYIIMENKHYDLRITYLKIFQHQLRGCAQISITPVSDTGVLHASTAAQRVRDDDVAREVRATIVNAIDTTESLQ